MPAIVLLLLNSLLLVIHVSDDEYSISDVGDLGHLLFGGFVLAVGVAIAFTFVRLRLREKKPPPAQFISISNVEEKK